jgi:hypothetical protein
MLALNRAVISRIDNLHIVCFQKRRLRVRRVARKELICKTCAYNDLHRVRELGTVSNMVKVPMTVYELALANWQFKMGNFATNLHIIESRLSNSMPASTNNSSTPFSTLIPADDALSNPNV